MNNFEKTFFKKYIAESQEISQVFHRHWIKIIDDIILWIGLGVLVPVFLYYNSYLLQEYIEFKYFEIYLFVVYIVIIYKIFDWYNDVLILTETWITRLEWSIFKSNAQSVDYKHIEWLEIDKNGILDTILRKWDVKILKFWDEQIIFDEAYNPHSIVNTIEEITSEIQPTEELTKFDLMMDTLWWIVENYLWKTAKNREDIFENNIDGYKNNLKLNSKKREKVSEELRQEFLENVEKKDGTIDLR
jgi:hypothetical protein